ncbi:MAG: hypothetical protein NZM05_07925 [Chloroherpetonaceae bacterium]|nr:hypothetical protein [Chloroherpetonaceae bacterium]
MEEKIYTHLLEKLRATYQKIQVRDALGGLAKFVLATLGAMLAVAAVESVAKLDSIGRLLLLVLLIGTSVASLLYFVVLPLLQRTFSPDEIAKLVGEFFPNLQDRLINVLQVYRDARSNPFAVAALAKVGKDTEPMDFRAAVSFEKIKPVGSAAVVGAVATALVFSLSPLGLNRALVRIIRFSEDFTPPPPFQILSLSRDVEVAKGSDAEVRFKVVPNPEAETVLEVRRLTLRLYDLSGFELQDIKLLQDSAGEFSYRLRNQRQDLLYFAESDVAGKTIRSDRHYVYVLDKPRIERFQLSLMPPAYSQLSPQVLEPNFGDAASLKGSKVTVRLKASKPIKSAMLVSDTVQLAMQVSGDSATVTFTLKDDLTYRLEVRDQTEMRSEPSATYQLRAIPDEFPTIRLLQPETRETKLPESLVQPLTLELKDDFGFSRLAIKFRVSKSEIAEPEETFREILIPLTGEGTQIDRVVNFTWNLSKAGIVAGDEVEFYAEVHDNDAVSGYKAARTDFYRLRLPSLEEVFAEVERAESNAITALEKKIEDAKSIQEQLEKVQNELRQKSRSNWQDRKALESALKKQEELQKSAAALSEELQKMIVEMQERSLVSEETLQKYQEVQRLLEEINAPELKDALRQLRDALSQVSEQELRKALEKMTFNEEQIQKSLERTKELLQRIQVERKIDELTKRISEMLQKQEEIRAETMQRSPKEQEKLKELQKQQESLKKDLEELQNAQKELEEKMKAFPKQEQLPMEELEKLKSQAEQDALEKDLEEAEQKLGERNPDAAAEKQKSALQKMRQRQKQLSEMKQELTRMRRQELIDAMQNAARAALELSKAQEELKNETEQIRGQVSMEESREIAQTQQQILESLHQLQESVSKIGKKSSKIRSELSRQLAEAEREMQQSISAMENRQAQQAAAKMREAMRALNEFAAQTSDMLAQMMGQKGGDGQGEGGDALSELMQSLTGQQSELNSQTESLMQGQGKNQVDRAQRLAQLAAQQRLIQEQLRRIAERQTQKQSEGAGKELLGNLEKLAEEMEESAKALEKEELTRELIKRQQQILSRMLQSTKSLQKREFEEQREAKSAQNIYRKSPAELGSEVGRSKFQDALNRLREKGYSDDYQKLIRRYYEALEKLQSN